MLRYIIAAFALAFALPAHHAAADGHVREYVVPYVPGAERSAYRNTFIVVTNMENQNALIDIKAHVNRSVTSVSCGVLDDLAPFEIRRFARNAGTLCVAADEPADASLRIRTVDGVHVAGYMVLNAVRGNGLVPVAVIPTEPAGPEGITFSTLDVEGLTNGNYRVRIGLRSSSRTWPFPLRACVQARAVDPHHTGLYDDPGRNCSLPNERLRGWTRPGRYGHTPNQYRPIETHEGSATSVIATTLEFQTSAFGHGEDSRNPPTYRVCIGEAREDGRFPPPFLCDTVTYGGPQLSTVADPQAEAAQESD